MIDLLVAGGGPAGLATALHAARAGLEVVVREPRGAVIDKACGEGLMPGAVRALHDLGLEPAGHPLAGIRYLAGDTVAEAGFRGDRGRGVRRTTLHSAMRAAVLGAGVPIEQRAVTRIEQRHDHVLADGTPARYLVAADGLHSPTRRTLGLDRGYDREPWPARSTRATTTAGTAGRHRRYGLRCHVPMSPWTDYVEVHWSATSEAYVTPVADDLVGVALLTAERGPFEQQLAAFPALHRRLAGRPRTPVRGAGPLRQRSRRRVAGRVLLVGDASGYVDALTGEGVSLGLAQARAAIAAITAGEPGSYELAWRRITWRYRLLTASLLGASRITAVRPRIVPVAAALPRVFQATVDTLARPA